MASERSPIPLIGTVTLCSISGTKTVRLQYLQWCVYTEQYLIQLIYHKGGILHPHLRRIPLMVSRMITNNVNENEELQLIDQKREVSKQSQGICLLFLSAFLFSFMGMFLQFTGRMGKKFEVD